MDEFFPSTLPTPGDTLIDNAAGRMLIDQQVVATWTGLETFWTGTIGGDDLGFVGTAADESVYAKVSGRVRATFGAGDDNFRADQAPRAGSVLDGGDGRDLLYVTSESGLLDLDLRKGKLVADAGSPYRTSATTSRTPRCSPAGSSLAGPAAATSSLLRLRRQPPRSRRRGHDRPLLRLPLGVGLLPSLSRRRASTAATAWTTSRAPSAGTCCSAAVARTSSTGAWEPTA